MHNEPETFEQEIQTHIGALADDPVCALSALTALSKKQAARAHYFTDKTYTFRDFETIFRDAITQTVQPRVAVPMH